MSINRSAKKLTALALAGTAVAAGAAGMQARAAGSGTGPVSANRGNRNAVPPILRPARASELAEVRATEALEGQAFDYRPPAGARYSSGVFDVFGARGGSGS